jgi:hypothetical protein
LLGKARSPSRSRDCSRIGLAQGDLDCGGSLPVTCLYAIFAIYGLPRGIADIGPRNSAGAIFLPHRMVRKHPSTTSPAAALRVAGISDRQSDGATFERFPTGRRSYPGLGPTAGRAARAGALPKSDGGKPMRPSFFLRQLSWTTKIEIANIRPINRTNKTILQADYSSRNCYRTPAISQKVNPVF